MQSKQTHNHWINLFVFRFAMSYRSEGESTKENDKIVSKQSSMPSAIVLVKTCNVYMDCCVFVVVDVYSILKTWTTSQRGTDSWAYQWHRSTSGCPSSQPARKVYKPAAVHSEICHESCLETLICLAISPTCWCQEIGFTCKLLCLAFSV